MKRNRCSHSRAIAALLAILAGQHAPANSAQDAALQVKSPDWREQVIYFLMIDRFADGEPSNNDLGRDEFDPNDGRKWSGGDLKGVIAKLDYIRGLGATAVWITPPVANQWWDKRGQYGGYHGYWARDFKAIDAHFGDLADYRELSKQLHARGMWLIQDVVVNHVGNYFSYDQTYDPDRPARGVSRQRDQFGDKAPAQSPFDQNNARARADREAAIYHFTPAIRAHQDRVQELNWQLADLDDLNTENPRVRRALRDSYGFWLREAGVDALRVDTAFYVPPDFFTDFLYSNDRQAPGMIKLAAQLGRPDFHVFGEGFAIDAAFEEQGAKRIDVYMRAGESGARLPAMINFPLYGSLNDVFARGQATEVLRHRVDSMMRTHASPHLMPTFIDNHDVERFLAGGSESGLKQALLALFTLPGIPTIYYGTEQGFATQRQAMFAGGFGAQGQDWFRRDAPGYRYLQSLTALRRSHPALMHGHPEVIAASADAGVLAYTMQAKGQRLLIALNSSTTPALLALRDLAPGAKLHGLFSILTAPEDLAVGSDGNLVRELPAASGQVWLIEAPTVSVAPSTRTQLTLDLAPRSAADAVSLSGQAQADRDLLLVFNGNLGRALAIRSGVDGRFAYQTPTHSLSASALAQQVLVYDRLAGQVSLPLTVPVEHRYQTRVSWVDPAGDDSGRDGRIRYPDDPVYRSLRPGDIRRVSIANAGAHLRFNIEMSGISRVWNPANGFDHVALTLFIGIPNRADGARVMPLQNAELPSGMRWHYRLRVHGWSNALFAHDGASAENEGRALPTGARVRSDPERKTIILELPAQALGNLRDPSGLQVYLNTWDYDGGYRRLSKRGEGFSFAGGDGRRDPLVLDETSVLAIPAESQSGNK